MPLILPGGTSFATLKRNVSEIDLVEVSGEVQSSLTVTDARPLDVTTETLRFLVSLDGYAALEALRFARRSLLREEWTRGREPDEPSLEDAVFTSSDIVWIVGPGQRPGALAKLEELRRRANLLLSQMDRAPRAARASGGSSGT